MIGQNSVEIRKFSRNFESIISDGPGGVVPKSSFLLLNAESDYAF